ncbi:MAG: hypothetical protein IID33_12105 [Planctomycetes bacterium]|nr:hypothetical protein [Planctomycetota bacterium]
MPLLSPLDRHLFPAIIHPVGGCADVLACTFQRGTTMRKSLHCNRLRSSCTRVRPAAGFSLAELVVSIGVLLLMFSLAGQVFTLTMKSTGQAKAFTGINQLLRIFEATLREDLRNVEPGRSVMLIQANPVNAYWTSDGLEADNDGDPSTGYPHTSDPQREDAAGNMIAPRADMLMFFTSRKGTSFVDPSVSANLQQVVYGHADLGEYVDMNTTGSGPAVYALEAGVFPAFPVDDATNYPLPDEPSKVPARQWHLGRRSTLLVPTIVPTPNVNFTPPPFRQLTPANLSDLVLSAADVIGEFRFEEDVIAPSAGPPWYLPRIIDLGNPVPRSQLDVSPPAVLAKRLGHYFIPNCASFKVEWSLDPRSEFVEFRRAEWRTNDVIKSYAIASFKKPDRDFTCKSIILFICETCSAGRSDPP